MKKDKRIEYAVDALYKALATFDKICAEELTGRIEINLPSGAQMIYKPKRQNVTKHMVSTTLDIYL